MTKNLIKNIPLAILDELWNARVFLPHPIDTPYAWAKRMQKYNPGDRSISAAIKRLKLRHAVEVIEDHGKRFLKLTKDGQIEILLAKAQIKKTVAWDKKWRLIIYDIPEAARTHRYYLRLLLKKNFFYKLQHSVFISPYSLNREAIDYLKLAGLMPYIRILKVQELDDDQELRKHFNL